MRCIKFIVFCVLLISLAACTRKTKVCCVGDSITEGYGLAVQSQTGYPVVLNSILGDKYSVLNSGRSATTLQKKGDFPFWICKEFSNTFAFEPDIIVMKLGTNDTKYHNWNAENFEKDYQALIDTFRTIPSKPKIFLCTPAPVFKTVWTINDSTVANGILPTIHKLAETNKLEIIDLYNELQNQGMNFFDSIHPNEKAVRVMAEIIAREITK